MKRISIFLVVLASFVIYISVLLGLETFRGFGCNSGFQKLVLELHEMVRGLNYVIVSVSTVGIKTCNDHKPQTKPRDK
eukprot:3658404-Amphidinium_carterae.1